MPAIIDIDNIQNFTVPISEFRYNWRLDNNSIAPAHLEQLQPLNNDAARFLWDYIININLHDDIPFKRDFFRNIDKARITTENIPGIKKWLYHRAIPFDKAVFLSWQPTIAMIVPWKIFVKYVDVFYYSISDDLTIIDKSMDWALLFYHEDEIYFGTNKDFEQDAAFKGYDFIW